MTAMFPWRKSQLHVSVHIFHTLMYECSAVSSGFFLSSSEVAMMIGVAECASRQITQLLLAGGMGSGAGHTLLQVVWALVEGGLHKALLGWYDWRNIQLLFRNGNRPGPVRDTISKCTERAPKTTNIQESSVYAKTGRLHRIPLPGSTL